MPATRSRSSTPATATWRCNGFVVRVGPEGMPPDEAFELARQVVGRRLSGEWGVKPLSPHVNDFHVTRWSRRSVPIAKGWDWAARLAADRDVARAEPTFEGPGVEPDPEAREEILAPHEIPRGAAAIFRPSSCSNDPFWSLRQIRARQAWDLPPPPPGKRFGQDIVVAHPDTGYTHHPEIWDQTPAKRRVLADRGYDFKDDDPSAFDPLKLPFGGHGTSTASVIMSDHVDATDDVVRISGVAPEAKLIPFRVANTVVHLDFVAVAEAIHAAVDEGAHVISMSLGGPVGFGYLEAAVERANRAGVIMLAAAGNYWPFVVYPARFDDVLAVAATNCERKPWRFSARGASVDLSAPGESVWRAETTKDGDGRRYDRNRSSGTSYAVAATAGACALWLAYHGREKLLATYGCENLAAVFRDVLLRHGFARPSRWETDSYGVGILRADKLLRAPLPPRGPARGLRPMGTRTVRPKPGTLEILRDYFPKQDHPGLRRALAGLLRTPDSDLDSVLATHGDELTFHVASDPALRAALHRAAAAPSRASARSARAPRSIFVRNASRALRRQMGMP